MHSRCIDQIRGSVFFPGLVNSSLHSLCMACKKKGRALSPLLRFPLCSLEVQLEKQRPGSRHFLSFFHCSPFVRLQNSPGQFFVIPRGSPALRFRLSSWFALGSALKTLSKTFQALGRQTGPFLCFPSVGPLLIVILEARKRAAPLPVFGQFLGLPSGFDFAARLSIPLGSP